MTDDKRYKMVDGETIEMTPEEIAELERTTPVRPPPEGQPEQPAADLPQPE